MNQDLTVSAGTPEPARRYDPPANRVEKYRGFTLVVSDGWMTMVWDATGHEMSGPVKSHADVIDFAHLAKVVLPSLAQTLSRT